MHTAFSYYLILLVVIFFIVMLAQRLKLSYPLVLVCSGLGISFIPGVPALQINPEIIMLIFLPPLLYSAAWNTYWKEFWKWRRVINSFAFGIVLLTACIIAWLSHSLIPGFTLAAGFLLGGIIAPTDAIAATTVLKDVKVPKSTIVIIEGESLLNDATSLIIYRFAIAAIISGAFVWHQAVGSFFLVVSMGIATGMVIALGYYAIHRWLPTTTNIDTVLTFIAPYTMYVVAESMHFSGVLAVVAGGLFLSSKSQVMLSHISRLQANNTWEALVFLLNAVTFMLIGLEFPAVIKQLHSTALLQAVVYSLIISAALILSRILLALGTSAFTIFISRFISTAKANPGWRAPLLFGWAGMRGVVSLAAALSIPLTAGNGKPFPHRDLILFITFSVIIITLVLQGFTLPWLARWLNLRDEDYPLSSEEQEALIRRKRAELVLNTLYETYAQDLGNNPLLAGYEQMIVKNYQFFVTANAPDEHGDEALQATTSRYKEINADLLNRQRQLLQKINNKVEYDEEIIRKQLWELDLEEEKLRQRFEL
ncbi:Na+/H+ antiporter [Mucilaginibacter sp.]